MSMFREERSPTWPVSRASAVSDQDCTTLVDPAWHHPVARLLRHTAWWTIFVLGPPDSGKMNFCRYLAGKLAQWYRTAC
jgi:polynucleotide 5'-kinase involved in rRNA processing